MFIVKTRSSRRDPTAWLWVMGTLVLPVVLLVGFGSGLDRALGASRTANPATVTVVIHPDRILMPDSLAAGTVTFEVTNRDSVAHGLAVRPADQEKPVGKLDAPVRPGASAKATFTLAAGSYRVYCPNAVEKGLSRLITVVAAEPRTGDGS
jgi:plastocyanin